MQHGFVAEFDFLQNERFEHKFHKILRALALDDEFAALIKDEAGFFLVGGKAGIRDFAERVTVVAQIILQGAGLGVGQFAGVAGDRVHGIAGFQSRLAG